MIIKQALILCGGKGTRLGEQTKNIPKPMVPVGGRPVLDYIMDTLQESGITNFILLAGHLGEIIDTHYQENPRDGCNIEVVIEPKPLGTAGAVKFVSDKLDDNFVVAYGDIFTNFNLEPMLAVHKKSIFNLGHDDFMNVMEVARIVIDEAGLKGVTLKTTGGARGWVGDSPFVHLDTSRIKTLGWTPKISIEAGLRSTVRHIVNNS